jgi:hypothetical protein
MTEPLAPERIAIIWSPEAAPISALIPCTLTDVNRKLLCSSHLGVTCHDPVHNTHSGRGSFREIGISTKRQHSSRCWLSCYGGDLCSTKTTISVSGAFPAQLSRLQWLC